jgi:hypothetical protein
MDIKYMKDQNNKINKQVKNKKKLPYQKPALMNLGDIRDVTMGGSFGSTDSGNSGTEQQ